MKMIYVSRNCRKICFLKICTAQTRLCNTLAWTSGKHHGSTCDTVLMCFYRGYIIERIAVIYPVFILNTMQPGTDTITVTNPKRAVSPNMVTCNILSGTVLWDGYCNRICSRVQSAPKIIWGKCERLKANPLMENSILLQFQNIWWMVQIYTNYCDPHSPFTNKRST